MAGFFGRIGTSFKQLWTTREGLSLRNIRPAKIHYTLSYALALLLAHMQSNYLALEGSVFGIPAGTMRYVCHVAMSVAVMLLWSERFKPLIRVSSVVMMLGVLPSLFLPMGPFKVLFACIGWAGLGGCVTACRCGFAFASNNAERLSGMFVTIFITGFYYVFQGFSINSVLITHAWPILLTVGLVVCLNLYREDELVAKEDTTPTDKRTVYFAMAYMIAYYATDAFTLGLVHYDYSLGIPIFGLGYSLSAALFVGIILVLKKNVWHVWNLVFIFAILRALMAGIPGEYGLEGPSHLILGLSMIGVPASLYTLGGVQKRFSSISLLKKCTILLILFLPIVIISADIIWAYAPQLIIPIALVFSLILGIGFILATPASYQYLFSADWMDDFRKRDMTLLRDKVEQTDRFENYGLTPREKEVAAALLGANTVRMIAGELKLSQSTVNMHTSNLYRKLGINSKAELFKKFGVAEATEAED